MCHPWLTATLYILLKRSTEPRLFIEKSTLCVLKRGRSACMYDDEGEFMVTQTNLVQIAVKHAILVIIFHIDEQCTCLAALTRSSIVLFVHLCTPGWHRQLPASWGNFTTIVNRDSAGLIFLSVCMSMLMATLPGIGSLSPATGRSACASTNARSRPRMKLENIARSTRCLNC